MRSERQPATGFRSYFHRPWAWRVWLIAKSANEDAVGEFLYKIARENPDIGVRDGAAIIEITWFLLNIWIYNIKIFIMPKC